MRTGESFKAFEQRRCSINPVCRDYNPSPIDFHEEIFNNGFDSHFLSADAGECRSVVRKYGYCTSEIRKRQRVPDQPARHGDGHLSRRHDSGVPAVAPAAGFQSLLCDARATKAEMLAAGYAAEGYGENGVVMCAVQ